MSKTNDQKIQVEAVFGAGGADAVYAFAGKNKMKNRMVEDVWASLNVNVIDGLDKDRFIAAMTNVPQEQPDSEKLSPDDMLELATSLLTDRFLFLEEDCTLRFFEVTDLEHKVCGLVPRSEEQSKVKRALRSACVDGGLQTMSGGQVNEMARIWMESPHEYLEQGPLNMTRMDEDKWSFFTPLIQPDASIATPTFDTTLANMTDPDAFLAWHWGVYSGEYTGRQLLFMFGNDGQEGKSLLQNTIGEVLYGPAMGALNNTQLTTARRFLFAGLETKTYVVYSECNDKTVLLKEEIKSLAACTDLLPIEHKHEALRAKMLNVRLTICSNKQPLVSGHDYSLSRLLFITIFKDASERMEKTKFRDLLIAEMPGFLHKAREAFKVRCPDGREIQVNDRVREDTRSILDKQNEVYMDIFDEYFEKGEYDARTKEGDMIRSNAVREIVDHANTTRKKYFLEGWKDWLEGVHKIRTDKKNNVYWYMGLRKKGEGDAALNSRLVDAKTFG